MRASTYTPHIAREDVLTRRSRGCNVLTHRRSSVSTTARGARESTDRKARRAYIASLGRMYMVRLLAEMNNTDAVDILERIERKEKATIRAMIKLRRALVQQRFG